MRRLLGRFSVSLSVMILYIALPGAAQLPGSPAAPSTTVPPSKRLWSQVVEPEVPYRRLDSRDKFIFQLHENFRTASLIPLFVSAGTSQGWDNAPHYGSDKAGFGERLGAAALRQASMRFLSDGLMPALLREDPRYFRKAHGGYAARGLYAASRAFVSQRDSGKSGINYANITGHLLAMGLTMTYYPHQDTNGGTVFRGTALSLLGSAGNNLFLEFIPDVLHKFHERKAGAVIGEPKTPR